MASTGLRRLLSTLAGPRRLLSTAPAANPMFSLAGRTAIVTGGTKGLGRVISATLLGHGAEVTVCARNAPDAPVIAGGREAHFVAADVRRM